MRRRSKIALLCISTVMVAAILAVTAMSDNPLNITIVGAAEAGTTKDIIVEFNRRNPVARFAEDDLRVQVRIAGAWQPPERFPQLEFPNLLARTNCERVVFAVPRQTEACRFLLGYRNGGSPRCQAYGFLWRHGVSKHFPKFASRLLKHVPQQRRLRHVEIELILPGEDAYKSLVVGSLHANRL